MSSASKSKILFRSLAQSVFDPQAADFWLQKINPIWSTKKPLVQIVHKEKVAKDTVSLTLKGNRHVQLGQAGQHHPVKVVLAGRSYERNYSLTQRNQFLILTVKKVEAGKVSTWLVDQSQVGDILELGKPFGDMQLNDQQNMILLAAGSGITPMYSLIQQLKQTQTLASKNIKLLYWVKRNEDAAFVDEFKRLDKQYTQFSFQLFNTQEEQADRLGEKCIEQINTISNSTVYACGPSGFVAIAQKLFNQAAIFRSEAFSLSTQLNNSNNDDTGFVNVTLSKSKKIIAIPRNQSILVGLEQANIKPVHGCRMGVCRKCVCQKDAGITQDLLNKSENDEPKNLVKICISSAKSDLVLDL